MTLELALKAVTGDLLIAAYNINYQIKGGDEVLMIKWKTTDIRDTKAKVYHFKDKKYYEVNVQDFRYKE